MNYEQIQDHKSNPAPILEKCRGVYRTEASFGLPMVVAG